MQALYKNKLLSDKELSPEEELNNFFSSIYIIVEEKNGRSH